MGAGALGEAVIDALGLGHAAGPGRDMDGGQLCGGGGSHGRGSSSRSGGGGSGSLRGSSLTVAIAAAGRAHHADYLLDGDLVALLADGLEDGAVRLGLHVEGGLAGLDGKEVVALLDGVAFLDIPLAQNGALLREALLGHANEGDALGGSLWSGGSRCRRGSCRRGGGSGGGSLGGRSCGSAIIQGEALASLAHNADHSLDGDLIALAADGLQNHAVLFRFHIEGGLAGLDGEEIVALLDRVAFFYIPLTEDCTVFRQSLLWHSDQRSH